MKNINSLSTAQKQVIAGIIILIVGLLVVIKLLVPGLGRLVETNKNIDNSNRRLAKLNSKINDLMTISNNDITKMTDTFLLAVPPDNKYLSLFDGIKMIANS